MARRAGTTMLELLTVVAIAGVLAAVAVPSAAHVGGVVSGAEAARRLALVLRAAQAEAQVRSTAVRVTVAGDGDYVVAAGAERLSSGRLGVRVGSTYPGGTLEFTRRGWAGLPGASCPRAGHFTIEGSAAAHSVIVQLSGCVRCR